MPGWFIATSFFDGDVKENTRYEYRITADDSEGSVLTWEASAGAGDGAFYRVGRRVENAEDGWQRNARVRP